MFKILSSCQERCHERKALLLIRPLMKAMNLRRQLKAVALILFFVSLRPFESFFDQEGLSVKEEEQVKQGRR